MISISANEDHTEQVEVVRTRHVKRRKKGTRQQEWHMHRYKERDAEDDRRNRVGRSHVIEDIESVDLNVDNVTDRMEGKKSKTISSTLDDEKLRRCLVPSPGCEGLCV